MSESGESGKSLKDILPTRREITSHILNNEQRFPVQFVESDEAIHRLHRLLDKEYALAMIYAHPRRRDPISIITAMTETFPELRFKHIITPMAESEYKKFGGKVGIGQLGKFYNMSIIPIKSSFEKIVEDGIAEDSRVNWEVHSVGASGFRYLLKSRSAVKHGDAILTAPQRRRNSVLDTQFDGKPIESLVRISKGTDNLAFAFIGTEVLGVKDYTVGRSDGFDKGVPYHLRMAVRTKQELTKEAGERQISIDEAGRDILAYVSPPTYLP